MYHTMDTEVVICIARVLIEEFFCTVIDLLFFQSFSFIMYHVKIDARKVPELSLPLI